MIYDHTPDFYRQQDELVRQVMHQRWAEDERQRSLDFGAPPTNQEGETQKETQ